MDYNKHRRSEEMKILIENINGDITTVKDMVAESREELAHFLAEIEIIKLDLLDMYENFDKLPEIDEEDPNEK